MKVITAVWTRDIDGGDKVGRVNVARLVREALQETGEVRNLRLLNAFETDNPASAILCATWAFVAGLLTGRPLPLQCILFAASAGQDRLVEAAAGSDAVYADGVRTLLWLRQLRKRDPHVRIVVDLDDLMSRRYAHLAGRRLPLSLGYLERLLPQVLAAVLKSGGLARVLLAYEGLALQRAEQEVLSLADAAVLLNEKEAFLLGEAGARTGSRPRAKIVPIPPAAPELRSASSGGGTAPSWRAVFVGTDALLQNRLTIAYLLDLWERARIGVPLFIYGRQHKSWRPVPNVAFCGYVEDISEAYTPGSILVCPSFLPGGIKTKVLEGFAYGVPTIGNAATFEGMPIGKYPLLLDDEEKLVHFLENLEDHREDMERAVDASLLYLRNEHDIALFNLRWREVITKGDVVRKSASPVRSPALEAQVRLAV